MSSKIVAYLGSKLAQNGSKICVLVKIIIVCEKLARFRPISIDFESGFGCALMRREQAANNSTSYYVKQ